MLIYDNNVSFMQTYTGLSGGAYAIGEKPVKVEDVHDLDMSKISPRCLLKIL